MFTLVYMGENKKGIKMHVFYIVYLTKNKNNIKTFKKIPCIILNLIFNNLYKRLHFLKGLLFKGIKSNFNHYQTWIINALYYCAVFFILLFT